MLVGVEEVVIQILKKPVIVKPVTHFQTFQRASARMMEVKIAGSFVNENV